MGPVKDSDILKNVKENNRQKLLKNLSPEKSFSVSKLGIKEDHSVPGGRIRMKLTHVNVNCKEEETGFTPLILAVLNGNKDIVEDLIFHSADVNFHDSKGNTALHMAAFGGKSEMMDLLLSNKAKVNIQNSDGNTALHILCQTDHDKRINMMLKLLQIGADVTVENKMQQTALDLAAMYNKKDAVSLLLDHLHSGEKMTECNTPPVRTNTLALVEASLRGYNEVVEMILDYGYNPNCVNRLKDTTPLIEAVRFMRFNVAETLLKYGAKSDLVTSKLESPESVAEAFLQTPAADKFSAMFKEYKTNAVLETPKFLKALSRGYSLQADKDYPALPNDISWTSNSPEYCNSCTPNCPNTNILDDDLTSCWIAAEVHHAWTVLDLKHDHTLTGITVYGWDSPQMVKSFQLQKGGSIQGPWSSVMTASCLKSGNKNPNETGMPQTFTDFTASSRYWRLELLSNHDGKCICFQGIRLYGADERIKTLLAENSMEKYTDDIIAKGFNTYKKFLLLKEADLTDIVSSDEDRNTILKSLERDRPKEFHPTSLSWKEAPVAMVKVGDPIPTFSVKSRPGVCTKVELLVDDGVVLTGQTTVMLQSDSLTEPSVATFSGLIIQTPGRHILEIRCVDYPRVSLTSPQPIEIRPKPAMRNSVAMAFDDMEAMLKDLTASLDTVTE